MQNNDYGREKPATPIRKRPKSLCFSCQCVNTRCLAKNNSTYWHLGTECEHPQLKLNVFQLTITKIHIIIPVFTHNGRSNQKAEQI